MAKALHQAGRSDGRAAYNGQETHKLDWRKRISDHVAFALLLYTGLHIFVTMAALKSESGSLLPYFALVVLVLATIPGCRLFEARWTDLNDHDAHDPALAPSFRRDVAILWVLAISLPLLLTGGYLAVVGLLA